MANEDPVMQISPVIGAEVSGMPGRYGGSYSLDPEHWLYAVIATAAGLVVFLPAMLWLAGQISSAGVDRQLAVGMSASLSSLLIFYPSVIHPVLELYRTQYRIYEDRIEKEIGAVLMRTYTLESRDIEGVETVSVGLLAEDRGCGRIEVSTGSGDVMLLRGVENYTEVAEQIRENFGLK